MASFIRAYYEWAKKRTDAPPEFHIQVALGLLSAACGNRVTLQPRWGRVFPSLWVILLGPSGVRKTTAINLGVNLLQRAVPNIIYPHKFTLEAQLDIMAGQPAGLMVAPELGSLLQQMNKEYNTGMRETLTDLYDGNTVRVATKSGGLRTVENPSICLLGGSTIEWLEGAVREQDLVGGFMARMLFSYQEENGEHISVLGLRYSDADRMAEASLVEHLRTVSQVAGAVELNDIEDDFDEWSYAYSQRDQRNTRMSGVYKRAEITALKLATLYTLSSDPRRLRVTPEAWQLAVEMWNAHENTARRLFGGGLAFTKTGKLKRQIEEYVRRNGGVGRSAILRHLTDYSARDIEPLLNDLVSSGVFAVESRKAARGPAGSWYVIAEEEK